MLSLVAATSLFSQGLVLNAPAPHSSQVRMSSPLMAVQDDIKADLSKLIKTESCGPILIRLAWHDCGVFSSGALEGGCPNAVMRFTDAGEGTFGANAGLPDVAVGYLKPIADKYVESGAISNADLWCLASNVAIEEMGGPSIPMRFGRTDAKDSSESVESQVGRLPDGDKGIGHLREIFHPKGFNDKDIVAPSGAHSVGACHGDRSGFEGPWTDAPLKFDNGYFTEMMSKAYVYETLPNGNMQLRNKESGTIMLLSDYALLTDPDFRPHCEAYAKDQSVFFKDFTSAWVKMQENGCKELRAEL